MAAMPQEPAAASISAPWCAPVFREVLLLGLACPAAAALLRPLTSTRRSCSGVVISLL